MIMDYEDFYELARTRRSIHRFRPEPVPDEYMEKILEVARHAPSGANSQPWEFIVIRDKGLQQKIIEIHKQSLTESKRIELAREEALRHPAAYVNNTWAEPGYANAPVWILLLGDPRYKETFLVHPLMTEGDPIFYSSLANTFVLIHLTAKSLGLGSQWMTSVALPFMQALLHDLLNIPKDFYIYDMACIGFPAHEPKARLVRPLEELVHYDRYDSSKYRTDEQVQEYIRAVSQSRREAAPQR
jgi:nitroreductase